MLGRRVLLVLVAAAVGAAACSDGRHPVSVLDVTTWPGSNVLALTVSSCNADPGVDVVVQDDKEVRVRARARDSEDDCADGVQICLDEPLAGRTVVDDKTDEAIPVTELREGAVMLCAEPVE